MRQKGKKGKEWDKIKKKIYEQLLKDDVRYCELRLPATQKHPTDCTLYIDGLAHSVTRQWLGKWGSEERAVKIEEVIAVCNSCHNKIEKIPEMEEIVKKIIERRNKRISRWKKI
jgi:hypothetical protein